MSTKTRKPQLSGLYAITDARQTDTQQLLSDVEQALLGGVRVLQYRNKSHDAPQRLQTAQRLRELTQEYNVTFIINDDPQLAKASHADGVHLGQEDTTMETARDVLGDDSIIGVSCYNRFELAQQAAESGADYVAFGRFFASHTKPDAVLAHVDLLQQAKRELGIPVVAIGGITADNGGELIAAGAHMLAAVDDIFGQADPQTAARRYQTLFQ